MAKQTMQRAQSMHLVKNSFSTLISSKTWPEWSDSGWSSRS